MGKLFLALASLALMLYLPAWLHTPSGEPYLVLNQNNLQKISTFTEPYHNIMKRVSALVGPKEEVVTVSAWQDNEGNMHFSDQGQQQFQHTQNYEVKNQYTGRLAFPQHWVWGCMFAVWLIFYISTRLGIRLLTARLHQFQHARHIKSTEKEIPTRNDTGHNYINYEKVDSAKSSPHKTLGLGENATLEEIKIAYRNKMKQYHPDKVAHLGKELQDLARKKATEINRAYETLVKQK